MLKLLLVGDKSKALKQLESILKDFEDAELFYAESGERALESVEAETDLVIADENLPDMTGLEFAEKLIKLNPVINCAAVSSLSEEDFHEASEGLGLMAHLPSSPERAAVNKLIENLRYIKNCLSGQRKKMEDKINIIGNDVKNIKDILLNSGYAEKAITYYLEKKNMGVIDNADQVSELTGNCGDTMKVYLCIENDVITDAKIQVLGCPGAIASAMAAMDLIKGKTVEEAMKLKDRDIFYEIEAIPDQKEHCISLTNKTIQKAIQEYISGKKNDANE